MKQNILSKTLLASLLFCGCLIFCQCKGGSSSSSDAADENAATENVTGEENAENTKPENEQLCGGYTEQRELEEEDLVLFNKVMAGAETATEYTPLSVATQVVAGINYRFYCRYDDGSQEAPAYCNIVIYQPLQGEPELTEITPVQ